MTNDITELAQQRAELSNPAIGTNSQLRKVALSLVEALEKAQGMETYWKAQCRGITDHCEELQACIAELESRTVKLPDLRQIVSGDRYVWSDGVYNYSQDVKVALAAAGIKVEDE